MTTLKNQLLEISQLCNEIDGIYHDIAQSYGLADGGTGFSTFCITTTNRFLKWIYAITGRIQSRRSLHFIDDQEGLDCAGGYPGTKNRKNIVLTDTGRLFAKR